MDAFHCTLTRENFKTRSISCVMVLSVPFVLWVTLVLTFVNKLIKVPVHMKPIELIGSPNFYM